MRANRPQNSDVPDPSPTRISNCNLRLKKSALQLGPTDPTWARALPNAARPRTSISARWASRDQVPRGPMPVADDNILYRLVKLLAWGKLGTRIAAHCVTVRSQAYQTGHPGTPQRPPHNGRFRTNGNIAQLGMGTQLTCSPPVLHCQEGAALGKTAGWIAERFGRWDRLRELLE
jgi:hypothetical protein